MRLEEVVVRNFCSCGDLPLTLSNFNPIIGYNNSGKSNILRAINWLLRKSVLQAHFFADLAQPVMVEGVISGVSLLLLPPNQQGQVSPYVSAGTLRFRRRQDAAGATAAQIKVDVFDPATGNWVANPTGLDNAIGVLFPEPLHIEAMDDAAEDVSRFAARNTIGSLLKFTVEQIRSNNAVALQAVDAALQVLNSHLNGATRIQELNLLEADASLAVGEFFPGLSLHLDIGSPQLDELMRGASVSLSDRPGSPRPFTSFGHGAQRVVQMALIKLLATSLNQAAGAGAVTVLLIDEPELYLHPQAIELLREALKVLSLQNFQVIFSTHSPLLLGKDDVLNTTMVYKDANGNTVTRQKLARAAQTIAANPHHASVVFAIQNSTYLLFSERVLIVEGKTEKLILPEVYETIRGQSLAHGKGCLLEASGSSSIYPMLQVLRDVGFEPKAVVDLDYIFKVAPGVNLIDPTVAEFTACCAWFAANQIANGFLLGADGFPARRNAAGAVAVVGPEAAFELMAAAMQPEIGRLAHQLRVDHGIAAWTRGAIEVHLGLARKDDIARMAFLAHMKANGDIAHAAHPQDIRDLVAWL